MSSSATATLFYGYCWNEELEAPWLDEESEEEVEDWEDRFARLSGLERPTESYPCHNLSPPTLDEQQILDKYSNYWKEKHELVAASNVEISWHCSYECSMPTVLITRSVKNAFSGDGKLIPPDYLQVGLEWDRQLDAFCQLMGIKTEGMTRGWFLVSSRD